MHILTKRSPERGAGRCNETAQPRKFGTAQGAAARPTASETAREQTEPRRADQGQLAPWSNYRAEIRASFAVEQISAFADPESNWPITQSRLMTREQRENDEPELLVPDRTSQV